MPPRLRGTYGGGAEKGLFRTSVPSPLGAARSSGRLLVPFATLAPARCHTGARQKEKVDISSSHHPSSYHMPSVTFDHVHIISRDPHAAADWYVRMLGGVVTGVNRNSRGATQVSVRFQHGMQLLIRGERPGEHPASTRGLKPFDGHPDGQFVSHDQFGTDHFAFRVHGDLDDFCESLRGKGAEFAKDHPYEFLPGHRIAYLLAPDGVSVELVPGPATRKPIDLYTWDTPNGKKISIALEEMGLPYLIRPVDIGSNFAQNTAEFKAISPNSKIPAIVDYDTPDGKPQTVFESGAILLYLAEKTQRFLPSEPRDRVSMHEWLFWQVAGFGPIPGQLHHFLGLPPEQRLSQTYALGRFRKETRRLYGVMNERLSQATYFAGAEYTIADMAIYGWVWRHARHEVALSDFPAVRRWYDAVSGRPAVLRALASSAKAAL
jgi:GST-like protein